MEINSFFLDLIPYLIPLLMIGIGFGWKLGLATVSLYLFEGIIGLPVFSGTPEKGIGLVYFTGPTMG